MFSLDFFAVVFAFLFVDLFDTLGTLIGVASKADMLDKDGKLPRIRGALLSDAVGTTVGAMFGYFYSNYFRRKCFWCSRRRKNRTDRLQ